MNNKKNNKKSKKHNQSSAVDSIVHDWETASDDAISDVLGSYTGNPYDDEYPIQDADDL